MSVIADGFGNDILCPGQSSCCIGDFLVQVVVGGCLRVKVSILLQGSIGQRLQAASAGDAGAGLALGLIRTIDILHLGQCFGTSQSGLQFWRHGVLRFNGAGHFFFTLIQSAQVFQAVAQVAQHLVIHRAGSFFAVSGNKWDGVPGIDQVKSVKAKDEDSVYTQYYDYTEPVAKIPGHRILALDRGEREGFLKVSIAVEAERAGGIVAWMFARKKTGGASAAIVEAAALDAYSRLIHPSLENELRAELTAKAAEGAITVFGENLRQLLLQPPIRGKTVMGLDPGYRMGCKVAVVDPTGKVLDTNVVYPVPEFKRVDQAKKTIKSMVLKNEVEVMAIGNGTAGHETEEFAAAVIRELAEEKGLHLQYMVVSEAGASVYSASKLAAEEFPQYDVNLRSAVSIARRLQDPLAELVKIDPKAVGVGQYQHDMPQKRLNETLDGVVEDCVNSVGVDLNTASAPLLARVAGITNATAKNIVAWREEEGAFTSRAQLKKVKGLGPKAFEQCAGFLRLPGAKNPLDATAVHPESYPAAKGLLEACGCDAKEIGTDAMQSLPVRVKSRGTKALCEALGVGEPTLMDIVSELCKPGRDVRDSLPKPLLRSDVMGLEDLKPGMELKGTVRNVIDFGAFVDIGVHQDGLVHVSQISDKFIKNPRDALKVGDVVQVKVLSVDTAKKRIALTMKGVPQS